jgi:hypothetical protein
MVLDRICRMRDMDDKTKTSMLHFRHGGLLLVLQKMVDEVVKYDVGLVNEYSARLQAATEGRSIGPYNPGMLETVKLIKLPLALVCLLILTCEWLTKYRNDCTSSPPFFSQHITLEPSPSAVRRSSTILRCAMSSG